MVDAKLIYSASEGLKRKVMWSEWQYCGEINMVKFNFVNDQINNHFSTQNVLCVCYTRQHSFETLKSGFIDTAKSLLGSKDFLVWDPNFKKVIEFNKIGVLRVGHVEIDSERQVSDTTIAS